MHGVKLQPPTKPPTRRGCISPNRANAPSPRSRRSKRREESRSAPARIETAQTTKWPKKRGAVKEVIRLGSHIQLQALSSPQEHNEHVVCCDRLRDRG
eukprot:4900021-Pleurochrysis_carterae.AAC.1